MTATAGLGHEGAFAAPQWPVRSNPRTRHRPALGPCLRRVTSTHSLHRNGASALPL